MSASVDVKVTDVRMAVRSLERELGYLEEDGYEGREEDVTRYKEVIKRLKASVGD